MHLKQLKVSGFKSFAETHTVNFNDGLTAIVGPNGCGKSNIIDAIRWVLGEQRPKALRSDKMEDVIFSGTIRRKPLNFCEVTLTIENDDHTLPVEYKTVAITRRIFRTGESEYLINKKLARLKDVTGLFYDTGMGIGSYSLMEQKQIDRVLSEKDEERRTMFEEAAGINKYRSQRKEALKNLLKTGDDLQRLSDIVSEKDRTVKMLARHVEKAKKYREYKDELTKLDVAFAYKVFRDVTATIKAESHAHAEIRTEKDRLDAELSTQGASIEEQELLANVKEEKLMENDREVARLTDTLHTIENSIVSLTEKIEGARLAIRQIDVYQGKLTDTITKARETHSALEQQLLDMDTKVQESEVAYIAARRDQDDVEAELAEKRLDLNKSQQAKIALMEEEAELKSKLEKIRSISDSLSENRIGIERTLSEEKRRSGECAERIAKCRDELKAVDEEHGNLSASRDVIVTRIDTEESRYRAILEAEKNLEAHLISDGKQLSFFEELEKNHEGYKGAVRSVIEQGLPGIRGIVADILEVDPAHVVAVEAALGSRVQYVLADDETAAAAAIAYLQEGKLGKASFAVNALVKPRVRPDALSALADIPGVLGWADRFVTCREGFDSLRSLLLHDVLLITDPSVVPQVRETAADFTVHCVTPQGDIHITSGVVRGGESGNEEMGLLSRTQFIETLRRNIERCTADIEAKEREKAATLQTLEEAKKALFGIDEKLNTGRRAMQEHEGDIRHLDEEILRIQSRENEALEQIRLIDRRLEAHLEDEKLAASALKQIDERRTENESQCLLYAEDLKTLEERRTMAAGRLRETELAFNALKQEGGTLKREFQKAEADMEEAHGALLSGRDDKNRLDIEIENHGAEITRLETAREESLILRREKEQNLALHREGYAEMRRQISELRNTSRDRSKIQSDLSERLHAAEMQLERLTEKRRSIQERVWEEYEKDLNQLTDEDARIDMEEQAARDKIDVLRKRLKAIGPNVNLGVLEDYEQEKTGFDELSRQKADLDVAKKSLEQLVRTLDKEASEKFVETFNQVRANFRETFITLFEGGEADIRLEDPEKENPDPLEAKIVIYARPSGKSMKNISLLSGGERALTATSLLFGLYLVKSSPYCILDEVDGPLDDANIGRFINLIRRFSVKTQFLIITHNKKTMAACDVLYGVTLIEPGVSRMVSVSLATSEDEKQVDAIMAAGVSA